MNTDFNWKKLYKIAGISALVIVSIIPVQVVVFSVIVGRKMFVMAR